MNIEQLYTDFGIPISPPGHRHTQPEWINTTCPWCTGNPGYHLGYNIQDNYYHCWRCGGHPVLKTLSKLLGVEYRKAQKIARQYGTINVRHARPVPVQIQTKAHRLPSNTTPLLVRHERYLSDRGFEPERLVKEWKLLSTGPVSFLDNINYRNRIVIPIHWNDQRVSFQARLARTAKKDELKYISCPKQRELVHHKDILYGQQHTWQKVGVWVEGPTDVWRMGVNAFATLGIEYTATQLRLIAQTFKRVYTLFDPEPQAQRQAKKAVAELQFRGVVAENIPTHCDPGDLSQQEADNLIKQLINS